MIFDWLHIGILIFLAVGVVFGVGAFFLGYVLSPKSRGGDIGVAYECGVRPQGSSRIRFGFNYYIYALLFLAFDVDVLYLFPVAVHYPDATGLIPFWKVLIFLTILALAVVYFWAKGVFRWPRRLN